MFACHGDLIVLQHFHTGCRSTGRIAALRAGVNGRERTVRNAVHILSGCECLTDRFIIQVLGQGAEQKHAMNCSVLVQPLNFPDEVFLCYVMRQMYVSNCNPDFLTALHSASLVGDIIRSFSYADDGQTGRDAFFTQVRGSGN